MSDPYRTAGMPCPHCRTTLRAFGARLICDGCSGILIPLPELEKAMSQGPLSLREEPGETGRDCPRCAKAMVLTRIEANESSSFAPRCPTHGAWFDSGERLETFFRAFPASMGGGGSGSTAGGHIATVGHAQTYVRDTPSGLSVQHWWERRKPRTHTQYKSPHGDEAVLACPSCGGQLSLSDERWPCSNCGGAFVDTAALVELMMEMARTAWELPPLVGAPARPCPVCQEAMVATKIEAVDVERCGAHGVWFGPDALRAALLHAAHV